MAWTRTDDDLFEAAIAKFDDESDLERWQKIASEVPGKSPEEIRVHYQGLVHDVSMIELGRVHLPVYSDEDADSSRSTRAGSGNSKRRNSDVERKRGTPWTEEEHRLFLKGLEKYGKGDWRSISRNAVLTRNPTQVASHAQKYFLRQNSVKKERKRNSIHDITTPHDNSSFNPNQVSSFAYQGFGFRM